jgi:hypothetical protein
MRLPPAFEAPAQQNGGGVHDDHEGEEDKDRGGGPLVEGRSEAFSQM